MGGTRYVPGTHLRIVSESAIARYQNIRGQQHVVCPAGTLIFMHHGIWHGGGVNRSDEVRYMFKIRLNPSVPQVRLWDTSDLSDEDFQQRPIFFRKEPTNPNDIASLLTRPQPWFEATPAVLNTLIAYVFGDICLATKVSMPTIGSPESKTNPLHRFNGDVATLVHDLGDDVA